MFHIPELLGNMKRTAAGMVARSLFSSRSCSVGGYLSAADIAGKVVGEVPAGN